MPSTLCAPGRASSASSCSACAWGPRWRSSPPGIAATWTASSRSRRWFPAARTCGSCARCKCRWHRGATDRAHALRRRARGRGVRAHPQTLESVGQIDCDEEGRPAGAPGPAPRTRRSARPRRMGDRDERGRHRRHTPAPAGLRVDGPRSPQRDGARGGDSGSDGLDRERPRHGGTARDLTPGRRGRAKTPPPRLPSRKGPDPPRRRNDS